MSQILLQIDVQHKLDWLKLALVFVSPELPLELLFCLYLLILDVSFYL